MFFGNNIEIRIDCILLVVLFSSCFLRDESRNNEMCMCLHHELIKGVLYVLKQFDRSNITVEQVFQRSLYISCSFVTTTSLRSGVAVVIACA